MNRLFKFTAVLAMTVLAGVCQAADKAQTTISEQELQAYMALFPALTAKDNKLNDDSALNALLQKHGVANIGDLNRLAEKVGKAYALCKAQSIREEFNKNNPDVKMSGDNKVEGMDFSPETVALVKKHLPEIEALVTKLFGKCGDIKCSAPPAAK